MRRPSNGCNNNSTLLKEEPNLVNRKGVILQYENARLHTAGMTLGTIEMLKLETLLHLPNSQDNTSSCLTFLSNQDNHSKKKIMKNINVNKINLISFLIH